MYSAKRIEEKANHESGIDIDWYFFDKTGKIAVVASGGGMLPDSVSMDMDRLKKTIACFRSLPVLSKDVVIEESVLKKIENYKDAQRSAYLKDLYFMASKGFYYFDKLILNNFYDFKYYLKAWPKMPLLINKNDDKLKDILPQIIIDQDINHVKDFFVDEIL